MPNSPNDEDIFDGIALRDELLSLTELAHRTDFAVEVLTEILDLGATPPEGAATDRRFDITHVLMLKQLAHWQREFDLSPPAVALVMTCLRRIEELQRHIHQLECMGAVLDD